MDFTSQETLDFIELCLREDVGNGDHSSLGAIPESTQGASKVYFKSDGILAGQELAEVICKSIDESIVWNAMVKDGDWIENGTVIATATGPAQSLLKSRTIIIKFYATFKRYSHYNLRSCKAY